MKNQIILVSLSLLLSSTVLANNDYQLFEKIFTEWTRAFNKKQLQPACALFAKNMTADYQGVSTKNYTSICDGFKKIFNQHDRRYHYSFKLHQVYRSNDLAVARITWYLDAYKNGQHIGSVQDEGLDVFKSLNGQWQIIYYLAYPALRNPNEKAVTD